MNSALNTNWPTLTPLARIENSDRHDPSTSAVVKFPYPTIRMRVEDPDYRVGFVSIVKRVSEPKKLAIKDQERSLTCDVTDTTRKPSCRYEASIPIIHVFGLSINQSTASHQSKEEIRGLNVNLKSEGSKLRAYWRTGQFPHAEMNALQLRLPLHDQALKSKEWAVSQTNAWIRVAQGDTPFVLQVEANPKKLKEREEERCAAEKETGSEENRTPKCRSLSEGNFEYETGLCPRNKTVHAWACPWRVASPDARFVPSFALENSTVKHRASYELGTKDDRILLAMFLRVSGIIDEPFELTPGLTELRDQIIQDYKTVLGIDGVRSEDKNEITQALTRQPQLYPFYEDRDFWATPVMADLAGKLTELGLR